MTFRRLSIEDTQLALTINAFRPKLVDTEAVKSFLADTRNLLCCMIDNDKVVAFAYGYLLSRTDGTSDMVYIHEVCVAEDHRHRGIGTALMNNLQDLLRDGGVGKMFLIADSSNNIANMLYRRTGGSHSDCGDICWYFKIRSQESIDPSL